MASASPSPPPTPSRTLAPASTWCSSPMPPPSSPAIQRLRTSPASTPANSTTPANVLPFKARSRNPSSTVAGHADDAERSRGVSPDGFLGTEGSHGLRGVEVEEFDAVLGLLPDQHRP